jgi:hypothetical protein
LRELGDVSIGEYLHETGLELEDIYSRGRTWTQLRRAAGIVTTSPVTGEDKVGKGLARLLHVDDQERIDAYRDLIRTSEPPTSNLDERARRQFEGLLFTLLSPAKGEYRSLDDAAMAFRQYDELRVELLELLTLLEDRVVHLHRPLGLLQPVPLQVHANYTRDEVLTAFGALTVSAPFSLQSGVYWHEPTQTDLLFVTLQKTEKDYSPTTRYRDYAVSDQLFHWESQSVTAAASSTGQRYLTHERGGSNIVLFIRTTKTDVGNRTMPYFCAGRARYASHRSERPIQITWQLHDPLPGDVFASYRAAVV